MDEVQIALALAVIYIIYRFTSRSSSATSASGAGSNSQAERSNALARSIPAGTIEQARALFPQLDERALRWEFVRTGRLRSLEAVAQSVLSGESPSPSSIPPSGFWETVAPPAPVSTLNGASSRMQTKAPKYESLIDRLGIQAQAIQQDQELLGHSALDAKGKGKERATGASEDWHELSLTEKKERMVLQARRRLIEQQRKAV